LVSISAAREGDDIVVTVADDGRGIDAEHLVRRAVEKGFITPEAGAAMSQQEALLLCCLPGFSTASQVTDISGRGVGMDTVQSRMKEFGGYLHIDSTPGRGTTIRLRFPRSIAIVNVLLVAAGGVTVAVPVSRIERMMELKPGRSFSAGIEDVRLVSLSRLLGGQERGGSRYRPVLVTDVRGRRTGLVADEVLGQQDLFVKPLGRPLAVVKGLAGAGVLGEGRPVFVLDVPNLPLAAAARAPLPAEESAPKAIAPP
ncbi:MAG TPA: chemotaxis protein CheW, partial [Verrucomicrobiae bacterium]|nr:chemotaxis protein CheW [Verrucomicrobiae bacterium]